MPKKGDEECKHGGPSLQVSKSDITHGPLDETLGEGDLASRCDTKIP